MAIAAQIQLRNLVYTLHERRKKQADSVELRRKYIASTHAMQMRNERQVTRQAVTRLQPGLRRAYLDRAFQTFDISGGG